MTSEWRTVLYSSNTLVLFTSSALTCKQQIASATKRKEKEAMLERLASVA